MKHAISSTLHVCRYKQPLGFNEITKFIYFFQAIKKQNPVTSRIKNVCPEPYFRQDAPKFHFFECDFLYVLSAEIAALILWTE